MGIKLRRAYYLVCDDSGNYLRNTCNELTRDREKAATYSCAKRDALEAATYASRGASRDFGRRFLPLLIYPARQSSSE